MKKMLLAFASLAAMGCQADATGPDDIEPPAFSVSSADCWSEDGPPGEIYATGLPHPGDHGGDPVSATLYTSDGSQNETATFTTLYGDAHDGTDYYGTLEYDCVNEEVISFTWVVYPKVWTT